MEDMPVNGSAPVPAPRQVRRAASLCAFAAVVLIVIGSGLILLLALLTRNIEIGDRAYADLQMLIGTVVTYLVATPAAWARAASAASAYMRTVTQSPSSCSAGKCSSLHPA